MAQNETRVIQGSRGRIRSKKHRLGESHKVPRGAAGSPVAEAVCGGGCGGEGEGNAAVLNAMQRFPPEGFSLL